MKIEALLAEKVLFDLGYSMCVSEKKLRFVEFKRIEKDVFSQYYVGYDMERDELVFNSTLMSIFYMFADNIEYEIIYRVPKFIDVALRLGLLNED